MLYRYLITVLFLICFALLGGAQIVNIPDPYFKLKLLSSSCVDTNGDGQGDSSADLNSDGEISINEALAVRSLYLNNSFIENLQGIQEFKNLEVLHCALNLLTFLDLQGVTKLIELECSANELTWLNLIDLNKLKILRCNTNQLTELNTHGLDSLEILSCRTNMILDLDLTKNIQLKELKCGLNKLDSLSIETLYQLEELNFSSNFVSKINFSNLHNLVNVDCSINNLSELSISSLSKLEYLDCSFNNFDTLSIINLPKLHTLKCENDSIKHLNIQNLDSLSSLYCKGNKLSAFNIGNIPNLKTLSCGYNSMTSFSLYNLPSLKTFNCSNNLLTNIDLSNISTIETLLCAGNLFTNINLSTTPNLLELYCSENNLTNIDFSGTTKLEKINIHRNKLTELNVNMLPNLQSIDCHNNELSSLIIRDLNQLKSILCSFNNLETLQLHNISSLEYLDCSWNWLSEINLHGTTNLERLYIDYNHFKNFNISELKQLTRFHCPHNNSLTDLFLQNGSIETDLNFSNTPIQFICCDLNELQEVQSHAISNNQFPIITTSCITDGALLQGQFKKDTNLNCLPDTSETALSGRIIKAQKTGIDTFYAISNSTGNYQLGVDTGQYLLSAALPNNYYALCMNSIIVDVTSINDTAEVDFLLQAAIDCPLLEVNIAAAQMRRCFQNKYIVQYCNVGPAQAPNAQVTVTLSDDLAFLGSSIAGTNIGSTDWQFSLGDVESEECGSFTIDFEVLCDSTVLGQSICATAHITPDSICTDSTWSGAEVMVDGDCEGDSVRFVIRNVGTGNMTDNVDFVVIEDIVIFRMGSFNLPANDSLVIKIPANGSTYRLRAGQEPTFPFNSMPTASVEGCGQNLSGLVSLGFVSQFGEDDGNPFYSVDCSEVVGSYDPNDKSAQPTGVGTEHYIYPETPIDYTIRFQNTGTDTAFTVVIRDTLSPWLDMETFQAGISDHSYEVSIEGSNVLVFTYNNIMLPDSNVNEPLSHGFIRFQIKPKSTTPLGTVVENSAGIYFDFNDPIITNTVFHTVDTGFLQVQLVSLFSEKTMMEQRVYPNPVRAGDVLYFENVQQGESHISLTNPLGRIVFEADFYGNRVHLPSDLGHGLYFLEWRGADGSQRWGRIMVR